MTCSVEDCNSIVHCRDLCSMHYKRWKRHGDPTAGRARYGTSAYERVMARTAPGPGDCIEFTGVRVRGYGQVRFGGKSLYAHRVVLAHHLGPSDLDALHSCDNTGCVNIEHLRWGTHQENMAEMASKGRAHGPRPISHGPVR